MSESGDDSAEEYTDSSEVNAPPHSSSSGIQGVVALVVVILVFSSNGVAYKKLFVGDPELFTPCSVLCGSNLFGMVTCLPLYYKDLSCANMKAITSLQWFFLIFETICYSGLGPLLYLIALQHITIASAAILGRLESLEFLVLAILLLGEKVDCWSLANSALTLIGILVALLSPPLFGQQLEFSSGFVLMVCSGLFYVASLVVTKKWLVCIPIGILAMVRLSLGTLIYHVMVLLQRGDVGVTEIYTQAYWSQVWWYAVLYVSLAQTLWLTALAHAGSTAISVGTTSLFVLTLLWAMAVLDSFPTGPQWLGSAFIVASVLSSIARSIKQGGVNKAAAAAAADDD
eukprot:CAMPEP_0198501180 /NCGR_PEP_ID=MMETSP1462-20131121/8566_1 /TAXON_ID=1333877 /ORGANISM="Brandtodinium nutriculum, Strain RCC3387" /LENGTH=342 /DNA_ID=CAMNT_0044230209 /DNA_START=117 /DNA_END=1145 /DNA_ORIENTATION=+